MGGEVTPLANYTKHSSRINASAFVSNSTTECQTPHDLLSSLCITQEAEGVGCNILVDDFSTFLQGCAPYSPLTPGSETTATASITPGSPPDTNMFRASPRSPRSDMAKPNLAKRNTCGTIYLGSTLSAPDKDALIKVSVCTCNAECMILWYVCICAHNTVLLLYPPTVRLWCIPCPSSPIQHRWSIELSNQSTNRSVQR